MNEFSLWNRQINCYFLKLVIKILSFYIWTFFFFSTSIMKKFPIPPLHKFTLLFFHLLPFYFASNKSYFKLWRPSVCFSINFSQKLLKLLMHLLVCMEQRNILNKSLLFYHSLSTVPLLMYPTAIAIKIYLRLREKIHTTF